ncbi:MAG: DUF3185 domain-containing protein [Bryobacteraceae bacterium]
MKLQIVVAILLILAGAAALIFQGVTYKKMDTVAKVGPVHVEAERTHHIPLPPVFGGIAIAGGVVLLVASKSK